MALSMRLPFLTRKGRLLFLCAVLLASGTVRAHTSCVDGISFRDSLAPQSALPLGGSGLLLEIEQEGPRSIRFRIYDVSKPRFLIYVDYHRGIMDCHIRIKNSHFDLEERKAVIDRSSIRGKTFFRHATKVLDQKGFRVDAIRCLWQPYEGVNDVFRQFVSTLNRLENEKGMLDGTVALEEAALSTWIGRNARDYFKTEPVVGFVQCPWKKYDVLGYVTIDVVDQVELYLFRREPGPLTRKRLGIVEGLDSDSERALASSREVIRRLPETPLPAGPRIPLEWVAPVAGERAPLFHPSSGHSRNVTYLAFADSA